MRAWLVEQGFEPGDLRSEKRFDNYYILTPMAQACCKGELNACKWLYNHGAAEDISRAGRDGMTPIGHLQGVPTRLHSHVLGLPEWPPVGLQVAGLEWSVESTHLFHHCC